MSVLLTSTSRTSPGVLFVEAAVSVKLLLEPGESNIVICVAFRLVGSTGSLNVSCRCPVSRSRVEQSSVGGMVSLVKLLAITAGTSVSGSATASCTREALAKRKVLFTSDARPVRLLIASESVLLN